MDSQITKARLIGYIRVENRDDLFVSDQNSNLESLAQHKGLKVLKTESEVANGNQIIRMGLWKALRLVACYNCTPKQMPMTMDFDLWFAEAVRSCTCKNPAPLDGIVVEDVSILCKSPPQGAKFTLSMCAVNLHLYSVEAKACLSCCNPQAVEFVRRQMLENNK